VHGSSNFFMTLLINFRMFGVEKKHPGAARLCVEAPGLYVGDSSFSDSS
jgi:hypothetical protein